MQSGEERDHLDRVMRYLRLEILVMEDIDQCCRQGGHRGKGSELLISLPCTSTHVLHTHRYSAAHTHKHRHKLTEGVTSRKQRVNRLPSDKESASQCRRCSFNPWVGKILWSRKWPPTPVFLPGKPHGQRNLTGYSPWGRRESDTVEHAHRHCPVVHLQTLSWTSLQP